MSDVPTGAPRCRYQFSDMVIESDEVLPELLPATGPAEVDITHDAPAPYVDGPPFSAWTAPNGTAWLTFADVGDAYLLTFAEHSQFLVARDASRVWVRPAPGTPPETSRHLLLNQVLPLVLARRGRLVLHASAVSWDGQVVVFLGRSGAGKSTLAAACAAAGATVVSDDCLVVRRDPADPRVWLAVPCDAGVRLWPDSLELLGWPAASGSDLAHYTDKRRVGATHSPLIFETATLPIRRLVHLPPPGTASASVSLRGQRAVMALAGELFRLDVRDVAESRRQFDDITDLAAAVPIDTRTRVDPARAAEAIRSSIGRTAGVSEYLSTRRH